MDPRLITLIVIIVIAVVIIVGLGIFLKHEQCEPARPNNLAATSTGNVISLTWDAVPNAVSYNVYISRIGGVSKINFGVKQSVNTNSASFTLDPGTYFFRVTAVSAATCKCPITEGDTSNEVSAATPACPQPTLAPPVALEVDILGSGSIQLSWTPVANASGYNVYTAANRAVSTTDFDEKVFTASTGLTFSGLVANDVQNFVVTTVDSCNNQGSQSVMLTAIVDCAQEDTDITTISSTSQAITITWDAVNGANSYTLYLKQGNSVFKSDFDFKMAVASGITTFTYQGLAADTTYAVGVTATTNCGEGELAFAVIATQAGPSPTASKKAAAPLTKPNNVPKAKASSSGNHAHPGSCGAVASH
jgi:fibronectin type 3 domain-containing protein